MSVDYLLGLLTIPTIVAVLAVGYGAKRYIRARLLRLRGPSPRRAIPWAARLVAARRAWIWSTPTFAAGVVLGHHYERQRQAEAVLLDEFFPLPDDATEIT